MIIMNDTLKFPGYVLRNAFGLKLIAIMNDTLNFSGDVLRDALNPKLKR